MNNIKTYQSATLEESILLRALERYGIPHPPSTVVHNRFSKWGRKGWYWAIACLDGYCFGHFKEGIKEKVFPQKKYTKEERQQRDVEVQRIFAEAEKEREKRHLKAKSVAKQVWDNSVPVVSDEHAYLQRKQVKSFGLRTISISQLEKAGVYVKGEESLLVIPLQDTDGTIHSVQFINSKDSSDEQSNKMLLRGGKKSGNYFPIGTPPEADGYILLCEGYSTGASLHEATGQHTIVCIDAGNLLAVAKTIRAKYHKAKMIMCADYDGHKHKDDQSKINVGLEKAIEAGNAVGAYVFHPVFNDVSDNPSDFNDLHCREGIEAVKKQVEECLQVMVDGGSMVNVFQPAVEKPKSKIEPPQDFSEGNIIEIIAYVFDMQSSTYSLRVRFLDYRGRLRELDLSANEVQESRLLQAKLRSKGFDFSLVYNFKSLHEYLKVAKPPKEIEQTNQTGWIKGNIYVNPVFIVSRDECEYEFAGGAYHGYGIKGTPEEWKTGVARYAVGNHSLTFGLCVGFSSILMKLFEDIVSTTVFHLYGKSSTGKTTTLDTTASIFGNPPHFKKSWVTTPNGLELLLKTRNDACLILDELGKVGSKAFSSMPYLIEGGEGKTRMSGDASLRETSRWRTMVLSAGEGTMADKILEDSDRPVKAGESVRFIDIPSESKHGIFDTLHGFKSGEELSNYLKTATSKYYGTAVKAFVEYIIGLEEDDIRKHHEEALKTLESKLLSSSEKINLSIADGQVKRVAKVFTLKQAAGVLAVEAGILPHTKEQIQESIYISFKKWLDERGGLNSHEERQVLDHVTSFLSRNDRMFTEKYISEQDGKLYANVKHDPRAGVWGYVQKFEDDEKRLDRSVYYIDPEVFKEKVLKGFAYKTSYDILKELGMLKLDAEGRHPKSPFDNRKRFVTIEI